MREKKGNRSSVWWHTIPSPKCEAENAIRPVLRRFETWKSAARGPAGLFGGCWIAREVCLRVSGRVGPPILAPGRVKELHSTAASGSSMGCTARQLVPGGGTACPLRWVIRPERRARSRYFSGAVAECFPEKPTAGPAPQVTTRCQAASRRVNRRFRQLRPRFHLFHRESGDPPSRLVFGSRQPPVQLAGD